MLISFAAAVGLTLTQWWLGSDFLALLFPWRISTYLVPLATAILVGKLAFWLVSLSETAAWLGAGVVLTACVGGGIVIMKHELGYLRGPAEASLYEHVRANVEEGDVYLVPYKLPNLPGPQGLAFLGFRARGRPHRQADSPGDAAVSPGDRRADLRRLQGDSLPGRRRAGMATPHRRWG